MNELQKIEQNFRELIIEKSRFCGFDKYLEENSDFEFPEVTRDLLGWENGRQIAIPGMFGGFDYFLEETTQGLVLYAEQSSRMDRDGSDYLYYEVTEHGNRRLEGEKRDDAQDSFRKLAKGVRRKCLQELKAMKWDER